MKFTLEKTSDSWGENPIVIKIKTLKELLELVDNSGHEVIIIPPQYNIGNHDKWGLEIYDDYRE